MGRTHAAELKMIAVCSFYLGANFTMAIIPVVAYLAYQGALIPRLLLLLSVLDYVVPLTPGKGFFWWWVELTKMNKGIESYFGAELVIEGEFRKDKNYLVVSHPHGLFGIATGYYGFELHRRFGSIPLFTAADVILMLPLLRRFMVWWGMTEVGAAPLKRSLRQPWPYNIVQLQPGGIAEMFYGTEREQIILAKRKGLAKVALQTGACLVPNYVFGANEMYTRWFGPSSAAAQLSSVLRTSLVAWSGRWGIPFSPVPNRVKMVVVLGAPLQVERVEDPTPEQIEQLHARYVQALTSLFDRYKHRMGEEWVARRGTLYLEDGRPAGGERG
jgi:hypothetical protein